MEAKRNTGLLKRWLIYKLDTVAMLLILGVQVYLFYGEMPLNYNPTEWPSMLLETGPPLWITTVIGAAIYWTIVDYHPVLEQYRESRVVELGSDRRPALGKRVLRSLVKSATLFSSSVLVLFGLLRSDRRFLHDYLTDTERINYKKAHPALRDGRNEGSQNVI